MPSAYTSVGRVYMWALAGAPHSTRGHISVKVWGRNLELVVCLALWCGSWVLSLCLPPTCLPLRLKTWQMKGGAWADPSCLPFRLGCVVKAGGRRLSCVCLIGERDSKKFVVTVSRVREMRTMGPGNTGPLLESCEVIFLQWLCDVGSPNCRCCRWTSAGWEEFGFVSAPSGHLFYTNKAVWQELSWWIWFLFLSGWEEASKYFTVVASANTNCHSGTRALRHTGIKGSGTCATLDGGVGSKGWGE